MAHRQIILSHLEHAWVCLPDKFEENKSGNQATHAELSMKCIIPLKKRH